MRLSLEDLDEARSRVLRNDNSTSKLALFALFFNMGLVKTIAIIVLSISLILFIALFGRLPVFRLAFSVATRSL